MQDPFASVKVIDLCLTRNFPINFMQDPFASVKVIDLC
jgi:hypothetical protein